MSNDYQRMLMNKLLLNITAFLAICILFITKNAKIDSLSFQALIAIKAILT
jgi:hypothetical protein